MTHRDSTPRERAQRARGPSAPGVARRKRVAATIRRIAREDRQVLKVLAAFDRGERPAA